MPGPTPDQSEPAPAVTPQVIYRHTLPVRLTHWINALALAVLLLSGLQIFNAHPRLYWGRQGFEIFAPVLSLSSFQTPHGPVGITRVFGHDFHTTGVLGASRLHGQWMARGWPPWLTLPSYQDLAGGRRWHLFFAWVLMLNGLIYLVYSLASRHFQRDLIPGGKDLRGIGRSILDHMLLRHPRGEAARQYNVLQKLTYLIVILVLLPLMVLTGLTMSPSMDAAAPWLLELFGGRQSARTIHFVVASLLVLFFLVHVIEVILAGPLNELRSIITGRYALKPERVERVPGP